MKLKPDDKKILLPFLIEIVIVFLKGICEILKDSKGNSAGIFKFKK